MSTKDTTVKEGRVLRPFYSKSLKQTFRPGDTYKGTNTDYLSANGFIDDVKEVKPATRTRRSTKTATE